MPAVRWGVPATGDAQVSPHDFVPAEPEGGDEDIAPGLVDCTGLPVQDCTAQAVRQASSGASNGVGRSMSGDALCSHSLNSGSTMYQLPSR
jgi:hypothetical protein